MDDHDIFGSGEFRYRVVADWPRWPADWNVIEVVGVATDSRDRAFVLSRGEHPVTIFDREGQFLGSWGEGLFARPHLPFPGLRPIGPHDSSSRFFVRPQGNLFWCVEERRHSKRLFTL